MRKFQYKAPAPAPQILQLSREEEAILIDENNQSLQEVELAVREVNQLGDIVTTVGDVQTVISNTPEIRTIDQALVGSVADMAVAGTDNSAEEIEQELLPDEKLSAESFVQSAKDMLSKMWETIKSSIMKMWEAVKAFFANIVIFFSGTKKRVEKLNALRAKHPIAGTVKLADTQLFKGTTRYLTSYGKPVSSIANGLEEATKLAVNVVAGIGIESSKIMKSSAWLADSFDEKGIRDWTHYDATVEICEGLERLVEAAGLNASKLDGWETFESEDRVMGGMIVFGKIPYRHPGVVKEVVDAGGLLRDIKHMQLDVRFNHSDKWNNANAAKIPLTGASDDIAFIAQCAERWMKEIEQRKGLIATLAGLAKDVCKKIDRSMVAVETDQGLWTEEKKKDLSNTLTLVGKLNSIFSTISAKIVTHHNHVVNAALDYAIESQQACMASGGAIVTDGDMSKLPNNLQKFIKEGDVPTIRQALIVMFENKKYGAGDLQAMATETAKRVPGLWMPFEEKAFARAIDENEVKWTKDYLNTQMVFLDTNFSKKRWDHVVLVRRVVGI